MRIIEVDVMPQKSNNPTLITTLNENTIQNVNVSVIVPTRNNENELKICLNALIEQTRKPNEVYVISESITKENISSEASNLHLKHIHSSKQIGPSALRNIGIQHCSGEIVVFLDDDSVPNRDFIETISNIFSESSIGIIRGKVSATNSISKHLARHYDLGDTDGDVDYWLMKDDGTFDHFAQRTSAITATAQLRAYVGVLNRNSAADIVVIDRIVVWQRKRLK